METLIALFLLINIVVLIFGMGRIIRTIQFSVGAPLAELLNARGNSLVSQYSTLDTIEDQIREQLEGVRRNQEIIIDRLEDIKKNQKETYKMAEQDLDYIGGYCYAINESVGDLVRNIDN